MTYDYLIVGSGSAGAVLAARLSEDTATSVLLIEAGPDFATLEELPDEIKYAWFPNSDGNLGVKANSYDWGFKGKATNESPNIEVPRGKVIGGSSSTNAQGFIRGIPEDFNEWVELGNNTWSFDNALKYYKKSESDLDIQDDFHGSDGPIIARRFKKSELTNISLDFYNSCKSFGFDDSYDINHPDSTGVGALPFNNPDRIRWSTSIGYLNNIRDRENLTIISNCFVNKILFDHLTATGVKADILGKEHTYTALNVILSAGAICSPQLLMLSGIGNTNYLQKLGIEPIYDLPSVGQNLRDHPRIPLMWESANQISLKKHQSPLQVVLRYTSVNSNFRNDIYMIIAAVSADQTVRMGVGLYKAKSSGSLTLSTSDPYTQPVIDYNYFNDDFDLRRMRDAVRLACNIISSKYFSEAENYPKGMNEIILSDDNNLNSWIRTNVDTFHHISGTCKMGLINDPTSVVDQFGNVKGVKNLRIVDASIMPDCVRANTNATVIMMAEKIADDIKSGN